MFRDREEAGSQLVEALGHYRFEDPVILALPRGGVPVAAVLARALAVPLDLVMVRKLGVPGQPEVALGAVARCGAAEDVVLNSTIVRQLGLSDTTIDDIRRRELAVIAEREQRYLAGRSRAPVADRTAIIVDDGIATGATVSAALRAVGHLRPARTVVAVPLAPPDTVARLKQEADTVICLDQPSSFGAISLFYERFNQVTDDEVIALLDAYGARGSSAAE